MNIFHEAKKVLDKDGKVNPLGPYGKQKLTGQEVASYFKKNKVSDSKVKRAVEVALDLSGAMDIAAKEIKNFFGDKILKSKEVQYALKYANEEVVSEAKMKDLFRKHKRELTKAYKTGDLSFMSSAGKKAEDDLTQWALNNNEIKSDDPDEFFDWLSRDLEDIVKGRIKEQSLSSSEKKLVSQMYDKKGNLTPLGKKVFNHNKKPGDKGYVESVKEAEELAYLAKQQNKIAVVDHHLNYFPARKYAQRLILDGKIGQITHIERIYRDNQLFNTDSLPLWKMQRQLLGGAFGVMGSHDIDYLLRIAGGIRQVRTSLFTARPLKEAHGGELIENNADDSFQTALTFHSGIKAQIHVSRTYIGKTQDEFIFHGHKLQFHR